MQLHQFQGYGTSETTGISSNGPRDLSGMIGLEREAIIASTSYSVIMKSILDFSFKQNT